MHLSTQSGIADVGSRASHGEQTLKIADTSAQDVQLAPRRDRQRQIVGGSILVVPLALIWLAVPIVKRWANASVTVPMERLRIATVTRGDLVRDISVQGRVVATNSPTLYSTAAGFVTLYVEAGASVEKDEILAVVESPALANGLKQSQSSFEQLAMELERQRIESRQLALEKRKAADLADVALIAARREKRRADQANVVSVISEIDFEKAQDELRNAELAYHHAVADANLFDERLAFELKAREIELQRQNLLVGDLQRQVDELAIRSPVKGIVGDLLVQQKSAVSRDTPILSVVDLSRFEIEAEIPESYADDLVIGMAAEIRSGAGTYPGLLVAVSPEIVNNEVGSRIRFNSEVPENLRQNQRLTTRVLMEEHRNVLILPRGQYLDSGGGRIAYVLGNDGVALRQAISIGARSLSSVEIQGGLNEGDRVVVSSIDQFQGAETVLVTN